MLTKKQSEILLYISKVIEEKGVSPSFEEMKLALNLKSKSGIHRLISGLEERGFIRRLPHKARALEVVKLPNSLDNHKTKYISSDLISIPFVGKIAAGTAIEAINNDTEVIDIPKTMINPRFQYFALRVEGDSMVDLGILDNDIAIIKSVNFANNGSVVVALIDDQETTLKKFKSDEKSVSLVPANENYEIKVFAPNRVKIQGILAAIYRLYI